MSRYSANPEPPYYAVIFSSLRSDADHEAYSTSAQRMVELAREIPGFLGIESYRDADRWGSSISYWKSEDDIKTWKAQIEHLEAQEKGRESWYERYQLRVSKVERAYAWSREAGYLQSENEE